MRQLLRLVAAAVIFISACREEDPATLKIIGGRPTAEAYPWFVQILDGNSAHQGYCGGTLIAERFVLTAAHCIEPQYVQTMFVTLGMADGMNLNLNHPIKVEGAIVHPEYKPTGEDPGQNDIALLYIADYSHVNFERPVAPLRVHRGPEAIESLTSVARVIGLGNTSSLGWLYDGIIREVDLPILDLARCAEKYRGVGLSQICAGNIENGGIDSCQGDSGGPLMFKDKDDLWSLAGIVSYGEGCAQKGAPGVYTRVDSFTSWIDRSMRSLAMPVSEVLKKEDLLRILATRCVSQFGYLPVSRTSGGGDSRQTVFAMDLESLDLVPAKLIPNGVEMERCNVSIDGHNIEAKWIREEKGTEDSDIKISVLINANGQLWLVEDPSLIYQQDRLTCHTAMGAAVLADQWNYTTVQFKEVFYDLGSVVADPEDGQTTWGCAVGDASLEIFEHKGPEGLHLAARIYHKNIGTVTVALNRADQEVAVESKLEWSTTDHGTLSILNYSDHDIFTWSLVCSNPFVLTMATGRTYDSKPQGTGSGFQVLLDSFESELGIIRSGAKTTMMIKRTDGEKIPVSGCIINDAVQVEINVNS